MTAMYTELIQLLGGMAILSAQVFNEAFRRPLYVRLTLEQLYQIGVRSTPLVLVTAASVGMVMALQFGAGLEKFGGKMYVPKIVSLSIVRELGPVFTSLMIAARVGAGITSEIGSMAVTQQIDAIRALGTSPLKRIVIPRVIATLIALPLLCAIANAIGVYGGMIVGVQELGLDGEFYMQKVYATISFADYISGFTKTIFFALFVSVTACYYGLTARGGTQGVGIATTKAVVTSSIFIFVGDYFMTKLFWVIEQWLS